MKNRSIRAELIIKVTSAAFIVITLFTIVVVYISYTHVVEKEYENALNLSRKYANEFNAELLLYLSTARTLATTLEEIDQVSRQEVNNILEHVLEQHPKVVGTYANYEPNKFDGLDHKFRNTLGSDSTGRFLPYWNKLREKGVPKLEVAVDMDISDWYLIPKRTKKYKIFDPYYYEGLLLVSFICPIIREGQVIGITGVDSTPGKFHSIVNEIKVYESGYGLLVSNSGLFVSFVDSSKNGNYTITEWANENNNKELMAIASAIKAGDEGYFETTDPNTNEKSIIFYTPIKTGNWSFLVVVPKGEIFESVYRLFGLQVLFGLFFILIINLILYRTLNKWIKPIVDLSDYASNMAEKFDSLTQKIQQKKLAYSGNEIQTLKNSFDFFVKNLMASYNELDSFINNTSDAIVIFNMNWEILRVNKGFTEMFGYNANEVKGVRLSWIPKELQIKIQELINGEEKNIIPFNRIERKKDGTPININTTATPIKDYEGNVVAIATISRDITDLVLTEQKMKEAKEKAEKADKLKSEFLAQMSHEIRTPINSILSFSSLIQSEIMDMQNPDLDDSFKIIGNAGNRIIRTIDLLLNMSELQTGSYHYIPKQLKLSETIIEPLFFEFKSIAEKKNLEIDYLLVEEDDLLIDEYTVSQIFNNLIDNAIKYTEKGKIKIKIYKTENKTAVDIIDSGIGIKEEYLPELFSPFSQEEQGYTRKFEGNGLGLALVKKYCELNNAEINVDSKKNYGSKFTVIFN